MIRVTAFRFITTVAPAPWWILAALAAAVVTGAATLVQDPREVDSALALVLLLQMYAAAAGFNATAGRGYFDPVLVSARPRWSIAAAHLAGTILPGVIAWFTLATVAVIAGGGDRAFAIHRHVALLIVSAAAWALGVVLPRMAPGVLWCAALLAFALARGTLSDHLLLMQSVPGGPQDVLAVSAACLICPFLLLGDFAGPRSTPVLMVLVSAAILTCWLGVRAICRRDYILVEAP